MLYKLGFFVKFGQNLNLVKVFEKNEIFELKWTLWRGEV